jgi:hypothetical protein
MSTLFDSTNYPEGVPSILVAGDAWLWKRTDLTDYATASYALTYTFRLEGTGATSIAVTASESGDEYRVEVAAATTAAYTVGVYQWQEYITRSSDSARLTLSEGTCEVVANRSAATTDPRSHAQKVLTAIEAVIEGTASKELASYTVDGIAINRRSIEELTRMREAYRYEVDEERIDQMIDRGLKAPGRKVRVSFDA